MRALQLVLKKKWFDMIADGIKHEEYREITHYWADRILKDYPIDWRFRMSVCIEAGDFTMFQGKEFGGWDGVYFYLGYAKDRPKMYVPIERITIGTGNPEWGAEPGKSYFVIKLKDS